MMPEREATSGNTVGQSPTTSASVSTHSGWRSLAITTGVSCVVAIVVWFWPIQPRWISPPITGGTSPIGFTTEGILISLDAADSPQEASLRLRLAATGEVVSEWKVGQAVEGWGELTPDGQWVILRTPYQPDAGGSLLVHSVKDGSLRCPPLPVVWVNPTPISPNARYKMVYTSEPQKGTTHSTHIVDLATGERLYPTGRQVAFSPDSRQWATLETTDTSRFVTFYSLADGTELGRSEVTAFPDAKRTRLGNWREDRLEIEFNHVVASNDYSRETWSFQVMGTQLGDKRVERALHGEVRTHGHLVPQTWWESGPDWATRYRQTVCSQSMFQRVSDWVSMKLGRGVPVSRSLRVKTTWQRVSLLTGWAITRPIEVNDIHCAESPEGVWLAEGGPCLRVWRVEPLQRWGWAGMAGVLPWLWIWICRRQRVKEADC